MRGVAGPTGLSINQRANVNPALSTVYLMTIHDAVFQYAKGMQRFLVSAVWALESSGIQKISAWKARVARDETQLACCSLIWIFLKSLPQGM